MSDSDVTARDLVEQAIQMHPDAKDSTLGVALDRLIDLHGTPILRAFRRAQMLKALTTYCKSIKASMERESGPTVSYAGRPMTSTLGVNGQLKLWTECSPAEFIDAVAKEQRVIDGRNDSNRTRRAFVDLLRSRGDLLELPTLGAALEAAGWDANALDLDDLAP